MNKEIAQEKEWRIESDARIVKEFGEIASNAKRYTAAKKYLTEEIAKSQKVVNGSIWDKLRKKK